MDPATQADVAVKLVGGGLKTPNEGRRGFNLPALTGGDTVYMQQQDFPLDQVRLNKIAPPAPPAPPPTPAASDSPSPADDGDITDEEQRELADYIAKELACEPI